MTKPFDALIPRPKLGRSRVQNIMSEDVPSVSRALLNDIIHRKASYASHPEQVNQTVFHLCIAYGEIRDIERRLRKLKRLTSGKVLEAVLQKHRDLEKLFEGFPLKVT